ILAIAAPAQATTYQLTATATDAARNMFGLNHGLGDFSLKYNDAEGNGLFRVSELVPGSFSGLTLIEFDSQGNDVLTFYNVLLGAAGYQDDSPYTDEPPEGYHSWWFHSDGRDMDMTAAGFNWEYLREEIDSQENAVPEPTTMLLLGLGLFGIAGVRRKMYK
ncbi:MAG: PEP-CTERM sorting domain-containing protein, partial [Deltaproteobacteria bacterium]|nr:PEP-CTERM sorting domain-containing protein [Deltaproteobacteria bacterium]